MKHGYSTRRLMVCEWRAVASASWSREALETVVIDTLTPGVTRSLPPAWQGPYTPERASRWIRERDEEGIALVVVEKASREAIGFVLMLDDARTEHVRLGYLLKESTWGMGYASELVQGFVAWSRNNGCRKICAGVNSDNAASRRVLAKNGFTLEERKGEECMYVFKIR